MNANKPRPSKSEHDEELLDEALEATFPASDPPAMVGPGGGITGPEKERGDSPRRMPSRKPSGTEGRRRAQPPPNRFSRITTAFSPERIGKTASLNEGTIFFAA